jgi:mRNA-degrading endonuclease toxin of MazEF toxin-antitoxin module
MIRPWMCTTMIECRRGDVVLVRFPFVPPSHAERQRRPAVVVQSDRYHHRRAAVIIAAITSSQSSAQLPGQVRVAQDAPEGREAGLRLDSVVDCQTLATIPRGEIVRRLGRFPEDVMRRLDQALQDALGRPAETADGAHGPCGGSPHPCPLTPHGLPRMARGSWEHSALCRLAGWPARTLTRSKASLPASERSWWPPRRCVESRSAASS